MAKGFSLDDYKDVAERITEFYEKFPDGSLTRLGKPEVLDMGGKLFVVYTALAYRSPDDPQPATGTAWEPFPGPTQYTKDSELMNAETAAWGRAIVAAGISSKKIASRQEVRNREQKTPPPTPLERLRSAFAQAGGDTAPLTEKMDEIGVPPNDDLGARMKSATPDQLEVLISDQVRLGREQKKQRAAA